MGVEKMYTIKEASEVLGLKVRTVREYIHKGWLKGSRYTTGRRMWHIRESEILRFIAENEGEENVD